MMMLARRRSAMMLMTSVASGLLSACSGSGDTGSPISVVPAPTPTPAPSPTPTPTPTPTASTSGLFVNPAPDATAADKAAAYIGWAPTTGATGYAIRYSIDGGTTTQVSVGAVTGALLPSLPQGGRLSVTIATIGAGGGQSAESAPVVATLPRPANATETAAYNNAAAFSDANLGEAVVVYKDGAVVYTHYAAGYANSAHPLASGTKSFSCAFEGFAEQDGLLKLTDKASAVITEWQGDPKKSQITLLDLLSLQSGLTGNPLYSALTASTLDTYQLTVDDTATYAPGQAFVYDPLAFQGFAAYFQVRSGGTYTGNGQITGGTDPVTYLQTKLFTPLGIASTAYTWGRDVKGHPQMAGGASFAATDWLKYGQFVLQKGTWQSSRLLPAATIDYCTGGYKNQAYLGYGITWWLNAHNAGTYDPTIDRVPSDGAPETGSDQFAPHAPADTFMAAGTGKERLYVIPSLNLAIVRFAPLNSGGPTSTWSDDTFLGKILGTVP